MGTLGAFIATSAFFVALLGTGLMRLYALKTQLLDVPNIRSSHAVPTPRGGGAAIVLSFFGAMTALLIRGQLDSHITWALVIGGGAMALIGFIDDRKPQGSKTRLAVQLLAAVLVVILIGGIPPDILNRWGLHSLWLDWGVAVLALVWMTNLFNFMDGIDGIAASEAVFITASGAWFNLTVAGDAGLTIAMSSISLGSLGFLVWNWPPARIFMGDVGSAFLGFVITLLAIAISKRAAIPLEAWIILGGAFIVDATVTLIRRVCRGDRWFEAHRLHAYQHLARRFKSHLVVTILIIAVNVLWLLPWATFAVKKPESALLALAAALIPLSGAAVLLGAGREEH